MNRTLASLFTLEIVNVLKEMSTHHTYSQKITASLPKVVLFTTAFTANWLTHKNFSKNWRRRRATKKDKTNPKEALLFSSLGTSSWGRQRSFQSASSPLASKKCIIIAKPNMHFGLSNNSARGENRTGRRSLKLQSPMGRNEEGEESFLLINTLLHLTASASSIKNLWFSRGESKNIDK